MSAQHQLFERLWKVLFSPAHKGSLAWDSNDYCWEQCGRRISAHRFNSCFQFTFFVGDKLYGVTEYDHAGGKTYRWYDPFCRENTPPDEVLVEMMLIL